MIWLLDTDTAIHFINRTAGYERIARRMSGRSPGELRISAVALAELRYGIENSKNKRGNEQALAALLELIQADDFPVGAARDAGEIRARLSRAGKTIGPYDVLIAAHARHIGATLVTNHESEFKRVSGLLLTNWLKP